MLEAVGGQLGGLVTWVMGWLVQFARVGLVLVGGWAILKVVWAGVRGSQREAVQAVVGLVVVAVAFAALAEWRTTFDLLGLVGTRLLQGAYTEIRAGLG